MAEYISSWTRYIDCPSRTLLKSNYIFVGPFCHCYRHSASVYFLGLGLECNSSHFWISVSVFFGLIFQSKYFALKNIVIRDSLMDF